MCGIVGIISNDRILSDSVDLNILRHRGPDHQGFVKLNVHGKNILLGHTRLAILDLSENGNQPMKSICGRWHVSFNGEIYNHNDLRKDMDTRFQSRSDTETLVENLSKHGIHKTIKMLNGMFAFVALDVIKKTLYLVRDPFGIKPLYYSSENETFSFSSEIRGIRAMRPCSLGISRTGLQKFLTLRYIPSPGTIFKGINKLPPGHILSYNLENRKININTYIQPTVERFSGTVKQATKVYLDKLRAAIERQFLSDVPVGILLSGGIDSALIAAMAAELDAHPPCFTVGFGHGYKDCEINAASSTAHRLGLKHVPVEVTPNDLWSVLSEVNGVVEEPLATRSILPMWYLVKKAREKVKVVLTGQGNDEPWGGYLRYQSELLRPYLPITAISGILYSLFKDTPHVPDFVRRGLGSWRYKNVNTRFKEAYTLFTRSQRQILTGNSGDGRSEEDIRTWLDWLNGIKLRSGERMMRIDTRLNLPDDLLLYGDKISMAVSLEARVPMLDLELIRFVESLPLKYKVRLFKSKIVYRLAAGKYLSPEIIHRPKKGFEVPFGRWLRNRWKHKAGSILLDKNEPYFSLLNREGVMKIWKDHQSGKFDYSRQLFALLSLALCVRRDKWVYPSEPQRIMEIMQGKQTCQESS